MRSKITAIHKIIGGGSDPPAQNLQQHRNNLQALTTSGDGCQTANAPHSHSSSETRAAYMNHEATSAPYTNGHRGYIGWYGIWKELRNWADNPGTRTTCLPRLCKLIRFFYKKYTKSITIPYFLDLKPECQWLCYCDLFSIGVSCPLYPRKSLAVSVCLKTPWVRCRQQPCGLGPSHWNSAL
jgi:hypothetical protein